MIYFHKRLLGAQEVSRFCKRQFSVNLKLCKKLMKKKIVFRQQNVSSICPYQFSNSSTYSSITPNNNYCSQNQQSGGTIVVKETIFLLSVTSNIDIEGQVLLVGIYAIVEALSTRNGNIRLSIKICSRWIKGYKLRSGFARID